MNNFLKAVEKQKADRKLVINFGKYKGRKLSDIYDSDLSYVAWVVAKDNTEDGKYFKNAIKYFKSRIAIDYGDSDGDDENSENNTEDAMVQSHCMDGLNKSVVFE